MIKVNLLRNRAEGATTTQGTIQTQVDGLSALEAGSDLTDAESVKQIAIKIVIMFSLTGGLMLYEAFNKGSLHDQLQTVNRINADYRDKIAKNQPTAIKA